MMVSTAIKEATMENRKTFHKNVKTLSNSDQSAFENLLDKELQAAEENNKSKERLQSFSDQPLALSSGTQFSQPTTIKKRPFLRRGHGLRKFGNASALTVRGQAGLNNGKSSGLPVGNISDHTQQDVFRKHTHQNASHTAKSHTPAHNAIHQPDQSNLKYSSSCNIISAGNETKTISANSSELNSDYLKNQQHPFANTDFLTEREPTSANFHGSVTLHLSKKIQENIHDESVPDVKVLEPTPREQRLNAEDQLSDISSLYTSRTQWEQERALEEEELLEFQRLEEIVTPADERHKSSTTQKHATSTSFDQDSRIYSEQNKGDTCNPLQEQQRSFAKQNKSRVARENGQPAYNNEWDDLDDHDSEDEQMSTIKHKWKETTVAQKGLMNDDVASNYSSRDNQHNCQDKYVSLSVYDQANELLGTQHTDVIPTTAVTSKSDINNMRDSEDEWSDSTIAGKDNNYDKIGSNTPSPPPVSTLVRRFYPSLREHSAKEEKETSSQASTFASICRHKKETKISALQYDSAATSVAEADVSAQQGNDKKMRSEKPQTSNTVDSSIPPIEGLIAQKLSLLDDEIRKFREETDAAVRAKSEFEAKLKTLAQEVETFEKQRDKDVQEFEAYKEREIAKLKHEKRVFRSHRQAMKDMPNKKDRETIAQLEAEVHRLNEQRESHERRSTLTKQRLEQRLQMLRDENEQLKEEILFMEKERVSLQRQRRNRHKQDQPTVNHNDEKTPPKLVQLSGNSDDHDYRPQEKSQKLGSKQSTPEYESSPAHETNVPQTSKKQRRKSQELMTSKDNNALEGDDIHDKTSHRLSESAGNSSQEDQQQGVSSSSKSPPSKIVQRLPDGVIETRFRNGTVKVTRPDGSSTVSFFNGDTKDVKADGTVIYRYEEAQTTHIAKPDGTEIFEFASGQIEKHHSNGVKEVQFPDGTTKFIFNDNEEETVFPDGTILRVTANGDKVIDFPDGRHEVHTSAFSKRRYPDGTVKIVYPDGRQETQYQDGRIRIRDKTGSVVLDTHENQR